MNKTIRVVILICCLRKRPVLKNNNQLQAAYVSQTKGHSYPIQGKRFKDVVIPFFSHFTFPSFFMYVSVFCDMCISVQEIHNTNRIWKNASDVLEWKKLVVLNQALLGISNSVLWKMSQWSYQVRHILFLYDLNLMF